MKWRITPKTLFISCYAALCFVLASLHCALRSLCFVALFTCLAMLCFALNSQYVVLCASPQSYALRSLCSIFALRSLNINVFCSFTTILCYVLTCFRLHNIPYEIQSMSKSANYMCLSSAILLFISTTIYNSFQILDLFFVKLKDFSLN